MFAMITLKNNEVNTYEKKQSGEILMSILQGTTWYDSTPYILKLRVSYTTTW